MKEIKISKLKLAWKFITGGREGVLDYALDVANSLADRIPDAKRDEIRGYFGMATKILNALDALSFLCPKRWYRAYAVTQAAFADLVSALSDLKLTADETAHVVDAFRTAYAAWRAE